MKIDQVIEGLRDPKDNTMEGRHGYDDAGFSLAPGHDEGEPVYNPRYDRTGSYDRKSKSSQDYNYNTGKPLSTISQKKGYVFYNVNDEMTARKLGLKQTKSGKWFLPADDLRQDTADKVFGKGRYWEPKSESTNESVKKADAPKPRNFVAKNAKMGGAGQHKDKKKAQKQGDVKHKKPVYETGALKVQKDDDKATVLLNPATGVQTQIDKTNPNAPRLAQDEQGKLKLSMAQGAQSGGTEVKPNLVGKDVAIDTSPVEDVHRISAPGSQPGGEITDVNPRSPISGDEEHDEISKLLNQRLRKLAGVDESLSEAGADKDLGNGFTLTTTEFNGEMVPAVFDSEGNRYWIKNDSGDRRYGASQFITIHNGKATGSKPGTMTAAALKQAGWQTTAPAPAWNQMTPDQQADVTARQQQQAADTAQGAQNAQNYWANKTRTPAKSNESLDKMLRIAGLK